MSHTRSGKAGVRSKEYWAEMQERRRDGKAQVQQMQKVREINTRNGEKEYEAVEKCIVGFRNGKNRLKHNWGES